MGILFWNAAERRPRALWRLVLFTMAVLVINFLLVPLALRLPLPRQVASTLTVCLSLFLAMFLAARLWDRRPFADYGFHLDCGWGADFLFGLVLGALLMSGIFLVEWGLGWAYVVDTFHTFSAQSFWYGWAMALLLFIGVGFGEEMFVRGYVLLNLAEGLHIRPLSPRGAVLSAWVLSSTLFGLLHLGNPHMTTLSTVNLIVAGLFLGWGYVLTGELALPVGIHIAWNFVQGNVFGFPVSGITFHWATLLQVHYEGPALWTGGAFGPEGGLLSLIAILLGMGIITAWARYSPHRAHTRSLFTRLAQRRTL